MSDGPVMDPKTWISTRLLPSVQEAVDRIASTSSNPTERRLLDGAVRIVVDQLEPMLLELRNGRLSFVDETEEPIRAAIGADLLTFNDTVARAEASEWLTPTRMSLAVEKSLSPELDRALGGGSLDFHVRIERDGTPLVYRIGLNRCEPPNDPTFTVTVAERDLPALEQDPKSAFLDGSLRFEGDYARALQIAMATLDD